MATHIRLQALKKLCELLETEVGCKVYRGRQVVGVDITRPFLNITEAIRSGDTIQTGSRTTRNDRVDFLLAGYIDTSGVANPIDNAYEIIGKIEQAFNKIQANDRIGNPEYPEWYLLGKTVTRFNYEAPIAHNPPDEVQSTAYFYVQFSIYTAYDTANPFRE